MADEAPASAEAAAQHAEAVAADAANAVAQQAAVATNAALHHAENVAAMAQEQAAERVAEIREETVEAVAAQEGTIEWLTERTKAMESALSSLSQRMEQTQTETAAALSAIASQLTPPPPVETPPETEAIQPEAARENADGQGLQTPNAPPENQEPVRRERKHRSI